MALKDCVNGWLPKGYRLSIFQYTPVESGISARTLTSRRFKNLSNERKGPVINVVIRAIITIIEKIRGDRTPRSYPIFSTINSIKPRVFMSAPSDNESYQFMPVHRAANALPPNFPAIATTITPAHINQSDQVFSKP